MREAKDFYLKYNCSYFTMCMQDYSKYMEYRRIEVPDKQEKHWKCKKINMLYRQICIDKDCTLFHIMYTLAEDFWDYTQLEKLMRALEIINISNRAGDGIGIAEIILADKTPTTKGGMIYWAKEMGEYEMTEALYKYVKNILMGISRVNDREEKQIRQIKRLWIRAKNA